METHRELDLRHVAYSEHAEWWDTKKWVCERHFRLWSPITMKNYW